MRLEYFDISMIYIGHNWTNGIFHLTFLKNDTQIVVAI